MGLACVRMVGVRTWYYIDSNVNDYSSWFDPFLFDQFGLANGYNQNVRFGNQFDQISRLRVAHCDRGIVIP